METSSNAPSGAFGVFKNALGGIGGFADKPILSVKIRIKIITY